MTIATNNTGTNTNGSTNGSTNSKARAMTPVEAISKISKILDQLSPNDQKRVLAFVSETGETRE